MRDQIDEIHARGAELVIIGNGGANFAAAFREDFEIDGPLLVDPERDKQEMQDRPGETLADGVEGAPSPKRRRGYARWEACASYPDITSYIITPPRRDASTAGDTLGGD